VNTAVQAEEFAEGENNLFSIGDYLDVILEENVRLWSTIIFWLVKVSKIFEGVLVGMGVVRNPQKNRNWLIESTIRRRYEWKKYV
jgi:hypothetical protein